MSKRLSGAPNRRRAEAIGLAEHERIARTQRADEVEFTDWMIWSALGDLLYEEKGSGVVAVGPREHVARLAELVKRTTEKARRAEEHIAAWYAARLKIARAAKQPASSLPAKPKPPARDAGAT